MWVSYAQPGIAALPRLQILSSDRIIGVDGAEGSGHSLMDKVRLGKSDTVIFMKNLSVCLPEFVTR